MNVIIIGAGKGGASIIKYLNSIEGMKINLVIDNNLNAPGIELAKSLNIPYSNNIRDIDASVADVIIEVTGNIELAEMLNEKYGKECSIIDSKGAFLLMTLVDRDKRIIEKMNEQINAINSSSLIIEKQLEEISVSIEGIHNISDTLLKSTTISNEYIDKSDTIVKAVNKIAQQTKILGINASIESARAGEHGRGFSIVAREVQDLAKYTQDFSREISDILKQISHEILKISAEVERLESLSKAQIEASSKVNDAVKSLVNSGKI